MKKLFVLLMALTLGASMLVTTAQAKFAPKFTVELSDTKVGGNPDLTFHLEFAEDDEEIGNFIGYLPKGFNIAADADIPDDEEIGSGDIAIAVGPTCHPSSPIQSPRPQAPIPATFYEKARTDEEIDRGIHSVWLLDLEPANRVRLLVSGSPKTGWKIEGAPTPSDATCNALTVDLTINATSESGVPIVTNAKKAGKKKFMADIVSQDSPAIAHFEQFITLTK
jgi:hypothetical protein